MHISTLASSTTTTPALATAVLGGISNKENAMGVLKTIVHQMSMRHQASRDMKVQANTITLIARRPLESELRASVVGNIPQSPFRVDMKVGGTGAARTITLSLEESA